MDLFIIACHKHNRPHVCFQCKKTPPKYFCIYAPICLWNIGGVSGRAQIQRPADHLLLSVDVDGFGPQHSISLAGGG